MTEDDEALTIYECLAIDQRRPLALVRTLVGASAFVASLASQEGWQIAFWGIDEDRSDCATAVLKRNGETKTLAIEPVEDLE